MTDKSAERRLDAAEPTQRIGATPAQTSVFPAPANDNAPPLVTRVIAGTGLAALLATAAGLAFYVLG